MEAIRLKMKDMLDIGIINNALNRSYDILYTVSIILNLAASVALTYENVARQYGIELKWLEMITVGFFTIDYILRVLTAKYIFPSSSEGRSIFRYVVSFTGIIDLLSFLPYWLPIFFPAGTAAFRAFRVVRIFRLFRINAYYDSLSVITDVLKSKSQQLISSVFIILVLMMASSLCMYSIEHEYQPDVFENAFSGIWWSASTLLTVGYGDIYPITILGKIFGIGISFLGVGLVAIPTGIISAGFVDQYSRVKRMSEYAAVEEVNFIKLTLGEKDAWAGKRIKEIGFPRGIIVAAVHRNKDIIVPRGDLLLHRNDIIVLGAESFIGDEMELKEVILKEQHPWNNQKIRDLDISRQTIIVMIKRRGRAMIPGGNLELKEGDKVVLYSKSKLDEQYINS